MTPFGILVKSYREDAEAAARLFASITEFNAEQLPVWVVVPESDVELFTDLVGNFGPVLSESVFAEHLVDEPVAGVRPGYINQEIVKIAFWELGLAANYLSVDSDAVFLRPFGADSPESMASRADFLESRGWSYAQMLEHGPYKLSWYDFWLQRTKVIPIELPEPYFKVIQSAKQHTDMHHETSRSDALTGYLSGSMLSSIAGVKIQGAFRRRAA